MRTADRDFDRSDPGIAIPVVMFGATFGNLFASGPKLNYDVEPAFDARAFGVWTHARGRCKVRNHEMNRKHGNGNDVLKHVVAVVFASRRVARARWDGILFPFLFDGDSRFVVDGWTNKQTDARSTRR